MKAFNLILKIVKVALLGLTYSWNLLLAAALWGCGQTGNIMLGILAIAFYRLSLWTAPFLVTAFCWIPTRPKKPLYQRFIFYFVNLLLCVGMYVICFLITGNWF